ncbi:MAG: hypothetical protein IJL25_06585 [Clostridia bacterium]|nr:hypothetical protein [Clostridia bacterium]
MVTVNNVIGENRGTAEFEFKGLHADTKPTGKVNGANVGVNSLFLELDTGDVYYFTGSDWTKVGG